MASHILTGGKSNEVGGTLIPTRDNYSSTYAWFMHGSSARLVTSFGRGVDRQMENAECGERRVWRMIREEEGREGEWETWGLRLRLRLW